MTSTIRLLIDSANDRTFAQDITDHLLRVRWRIGMADPLDRLAAPLEGEVLLDAVGLDASEWEGLAVRVVRGVQPLLTACIGEISQNAGRGLPQIRLHLRDALTELHQLPASAMMSAPVLSGEAIESLLTSLPLRQRWLAGRWRLGVAGYSELGTVRLPPAIALDADEGRTGLAHWDDERPLLGVLRDIAEAEGGVFFCDADDQFVFRGRQTLLSTHNPTVTLTDAFEQLTVQRTPVVNWISVRTSPVRQGMPGSVLWQSDAPILCAPNAITRLALRWRDADERAITAVDVLPPVRGVDLRFGLTSSTYHAASTGAVGVALLDQQAAGAVLELRNPFPWALTLLPGAAVRGTPLIRLPQPVTVVQNNASIARDGLHAMSLSLPMIEGNADGLARFYLTAHEAPSRSVYSVTLDALHQPASLNAHLWDTVTLSLTQPPLTVTAFITTQTHEITHGGLRHRLQWQLRDIAPWRCWLLGTRTLNQDTRLAY